MSLARSSRSSLLGVSAVQRAQARRGRRFAILAALLAFSAVLTVIHNRAARSESVDPVTAAVRTVTVPVVNGVSNTWEWISGQVGWVFRGRGVDAENQKLREENARLQEEVSRLREAEITASRLRSQIGFAESTPAKIPADIVSMKPQGSDTLIISRGSRDGIRKYSVVVSPRGVVGFAYDLAPTSCGVMLATSLQSSIGCRVQRPESRAIGVCRGTGKGTMNMMYLAPDASVKVGDVVITSGLGGDQGVFPAGLVLGTVSTVSRPGSGSSRTVTIKPSVDAGKLEEVFVLK